MNQKAYVNKEWEDALSQAICLLEKNDITSAQNTLRPFYGFAHYKNIADEILQDYMHYKTFKSAYDNHDYKLMYAMAAKYKHFKESSLYMQTEQKWQKIISAAVNQLSNSRKSNSSQFISLLEPFLGVSDKAPIIQLLIKDADAFVKFEQAIAKKDYESVLAVAEKYPTLKQSSDYQTVVLFGETLLANSELAVKKGDIATAKKLLLLLDRFPSYQANYLSLDGRIGKISKMHQLIEERKYKEFFELCGRYPYLESTEQYPKLLEIAKAGK